MSCRSLFAVLFPFLLVACEKAVFDDEKQMGQGQSSSAKTRGGLTLSITQLEQLPLPVVASEAAMAVPEHLNYAVYDQEGNRVKQVNQKKGDSDYGVAYMPLDEGTYQLVVLAHSSSKNPAMTSAERIQFNNSLGYTDTYLYCTTLTVDDEPLSLDLSLRRIAALCRMVVTDAVPDGVSQLRFQYTGGSGYLNARTGMGTGNTTQVVVRPVQAGEQYLVIDLYTFLSGETGTISVVATALDAAGEKLFDRVFSVPMKQNRLTRLSGRFFTKDNDPEKWTVDIDVPFEALWGIEVFYTY